MTPITKLLVVLAAAGVISVIHAMTSSNAVAPRKHLNGVQDTHAFSAGEPSGPISQINALLNTDNSVSQTLIVNNIYQADTGGFYIELERQQDQAQAYAIAPLLSSDFDVSVIGNIVRTKVTQTFNNQSQQWQNGIYVFPLPEDAAVDAMLMQIDERKIEGRIQEKTKAKAAFNAAKNAGKSASLVSQLRPNMFVNRVANIAPNATIVVTIEYQQLLRSNIKPLGSDKQYQVRIPTAITPRYFPKEQTSDPDLSASVNSPYSSLSINVQIDMGVALRNIRSEHHIVKADSPTDAEQKYRVFVDTENAAGNTVNKEFVLNWQLAQHAQPVAAHLTQTSGGYQYGLIQIIPPTADVLPAQREVTFILDTSGSMAGEAIDQAKIALNTAISELQASDTFNIIEFNSTAQNLWSSSQAANQQNKAIASRFVNTRQASGGTEMAAALELAFSLHDKALPNASSAEVLQQILFITDGSVSNEAQLLKLISTNLKQQRLFTIGIGSAPNTYFMSEAAMAGRGTFTLIGDISLVNEKMSELLTKIKHPALTDVQVNINPQYHDTEFEIYPNKIPDVYAGEPITLVYRIAQPSTDLHSENFTLQAQWRAINPDGPERPILWQSQLSQNNRDTSSGISKYWAYSKIAQLKRTLHTSEASGEDFLALQQYTQQTITNTALQHHLVSQHTSLIAIDHQQSRPSAEYLAMLAQKKQIDALTNKQWSATQMHLPQTSTSSLLYVCLGLLLSSFSLLMIVLGVRR